MCESERHVTVLVPPFKFLLIETTDSKEGLHDTGSCLKAVAVSNEQWRHPRLIG